ncbi:hypothetical protein AB0D59_02875 [Streptomyces sp. NPDC048417]|uniref:hypothetical protein n=1 Tax=Streptomyces sp. NPDC048417 TaxID=3155387 RepID=UPI0034195E17
MFEEPGVVSATADDPHSAVLGREQGHGPGPEGRQYLFGDQIDHATHAHGFGEGGGQVEHLVDLAQGDRLAEERPRPGGLGL